MDLNGKTVVVTGASRGIGASIAENFAGAGATVALVARSQGPLEQQAARLAGHAIVADLSTADGVDGLVADCIDRLGHIDVWVNNAGVETSDAFAATDRAAVRTVLRVNFEAPVLLTRDVLDHMLERGHGHIVQMSSVAAAIPFPGLTAYAGTKSGLTAFTESLRIELADTPIGLTVIAPGPVDTEMWERLEVADAYQAPALKRFRRLGFLPKLSPEVVAARTVEAVANDKPFVGLPRRYAGYHALSNAPRRLVKAALTGVRLPSAR